MATLIATTVQWEGRFYDDGSLNFPDEVRGVALNEKVCRAHLVRERRSSSLEF